MHIEFTKVNEGKFVWSGQKICDNFFDVYRDLGTEVYDRSLSRLTKNTTKTRSYKRIVESFFTYGFELLVFGKQSEKMVRAVENEYWICCGYMRLD